MSLFQLSSRPPDLDQLSKQIAKIGRIEKCEGCGCYVDTINEFKAVLDQTPDAPATACERIAELEARHQPTHGCIGCDPCYPVAISNTLYAISGGASVENVRPIKFDVGQNEAGHGTSCGCEPRRRRRIQFQLRSGRKPHGRLNQATTGWVASTAASPSRRSPARNFIIISPTRSAATAPSAARSSPKTSASRRSSKTSSPIATSAFWSSAARRRRAI